jgi:hypothetical protein
MGNFLFDAVMYRTTDNEKNYVINYATVIL